METKELIERLHRGVQEYEPIAGAEIHAWNIGNADDAMEEAADRLSEQQQVIDELVSAMEMIAGITPCPDDLMGNVDIAHAALSRAKGHTKEAD